MGSGVSCCGGKSTDIVDSTKAPIDKRTIGVGDSGPDLADTGTQPEIDDEEDSGRVSPTPSLDSVYQLVEGDSYTKTPVPSRIGRGAQTDTTSDYDSSSGNISTSSRPSGQSTGNAGSSLVTTGNENQRQHQRESDNVGTDTSYLQRPSQVNRNSRLPPLSTSKSNNVNKHYPSSTNRGNGYRNPEFVGSIGNINEKNNNGYKQGKPKIHSLQDFQPGMSCESKHQEARNLSNNTFQRPDKGIKNDWGRGNRLGSSNESTNSTRRDISAYVPSSASRVHSSTSYSNSTDPQYILNNGGRNSTGSSTSRSTGFVGHDPLTNSIGNNRPNGSVKSSELSVSGQAMPFHGRRRDPHSNKNTNVPQRNKSESFYLPMDSLVAPKKDKSKKRNKRGKGGHAFMITFDEDGTSTQPLQKDESSNSSEESDTDSNTTSGMQTFGDYSYNLSRSNSRSTTMSDVMADTDKTHNSSKKTVDECRNQNRQTNNTKNTSHYNKNKTIPTAAISALPRRDTYQPPNPYGRTKYGNKHPKSEVDALTQHIGDLRQLLSLHMRHIPNNKNSSTARISGDGNQKQESKDSDNLIQKLQSEIVSLEEKLLESENQILALQNKDEHVDEEENESQLIEMGVQVNQETMETGTTIDNQMNELHMNFEKMLSDLDQEAVIKINNARDASLSEDEVQALIQEHMRNRELLKNNLQHEKALLDEKLKKRLDDRKRKEMMGNIDSKDSSSDAMHVHSSNNEENDWKNNKHEWRPGLCAIGEQDENMVKRSLVRSNTFTKEDDINDDQINDQDNLVRSNTFTGTAHATKDVGNSMKVENDALHAGTSTQRGNDEKINERASHEKNVGTDRLGDFDMLNKNMKNLVENIPNELQIQDENFIENVWEKRHEMSAEELVCLLKQHLQDQQKLQEIKISEAEKQHADFKRKFNDRLNANKAVNGMSGASEEDKEMEALATSVDAAINTIRTQTDILPEPILPRSDEEVFRILSEHRRNKEALLSSMMQGKLKQMENLQQKLLQKQKVPKVSNSISVQSEYASQDQWTQPMNVSETISVETDIMPIRRKRIATENPENIPDVTGVLQEHKERVQELRHIKQEHGKVHQEKVQERLAKRLGKPTRDMEND